MGNERESNSAPAVDGVPFGPFIDGCCPAQDVLLQSPTASDPGVWLLDRIWDSVKASESRIRMQKAHRMLGIRSPSSWEVDARGRLQLLILVDKVLGMRRACSGLSRGVTRM